MIAFVNTHNGIALNGLSAPSGLGDGGGLLDFIGINSILSSGSKTAGQTFAAAEAAEAARIASKQRTSTVAIVGGIAAAAAGLGLIYFLVTK